MSGTLRVFGTNSSDASGALETQERILQSQREKGRDRDRTAVERKSSVITSPNCVIFITRHRAGFTRVTVTRERLRSCRHH